ncbi:copper-binding protein [Aliivibrio fischeri]|uniref:copper-resistant cuproprotein CopI n=1 Tax=Aliivibrio fischeri TaxID=668 RepID=UPI0012D8E815|nr:cupredoxin family protein [Aliivibrio fischeri]MUK63757.1 copper-binding protein [Aliivibrio fischeri]MUL22947.1 copper-binding protein [Aliivibrio fischeri]MUL22994.1 copper-binding protein [Aliivibrio fischeri]
MKKTVLAIALTLVASSAMAEMDHSKMDHSSMDMKSMDMSKMDSMSMKDMNAVGMPATGMKPDKVVHVILSDDMKITFKKEVDIQPNDIVQFVIMNTGKIDHDFAIGNEAEQLEHREMMKKMTSGHAHDSGSTVTVKPGKAKQIIWHFHGDKNVEFACNIPGHAEAGMVKKITL